MSKHASSAAEDQTTGRELVPAGIDATDEVPAHVKARPIPRISIQAFCEDSATAEVLQTATAIAASPSPTSACTWVARRRPWRTTMKTRRRT
jgi:hypothetical protein